MWVIDTYFLYQNGIDVTVIVIKDDLKVEKGEMTKNVPPIFI